jgi:hypothetical protein
MARVSLSLWERGGAAKPYGEAEWGRGAARPRPKGVRSLLSSTRRASRLVI